MMKSESATGSIGRFARRWWPALACLAIAGVCISYLGKPAANPPSGPRPAHPDTVDRGALRPFRVVNGHEHLMSVKFLDKYFAACEATGVVQTLFVGSSAYTLMGGQHDQLKGNDENSEEILNAAKSQPDRIIPFCTIHPADPDKLAKLQAFVARGAKGLKLYTGHGNFYKLPLDDPGMMPVYAWCDAQRLPICWHVNCGKYLAEFERVLQKFPQLIVIVPHFGVTFFRPGNNHWLAFERLMATYPNLYTDTSFGTRGILVSGLEAVSRNPKPFQDFFAKFGDRVLFGTDLVVTGNREKTPEWIAEVIRACREMLEKERYAFAMGAQGSKYAADPTNTKGYFWGLGLDDATLKKVYETNILRLFPKR